MVRRRIPLSRRFRAIRGQLLLGAVWLGAVAATIALTFAEDPHSYGRGVAVIDTRPVLAPESGRIASVAVTPGQAVAAGDVLAVLEVPGLAQRIAAADAEVAAARRLLETGDPDRARRFARDVDSLRAQLLSTRVDLESERARLVGFESELTRLSAPGVAVSASVVDAARAQRDASKATVAAREAEVAGLERAVAGAQARVSDSGDPAATALAVAVADRDALQAELEANTLRAFTGGHVEGRVPAAGEWVQAGLPVLTLVAPPSGEVVAYVSVVHAQRLHTGAQLSVRPDSGHVVPAVIERVGVQVQQVPLRQQRDPTVPEWGVPVTLKVADVGLTPGELVSVDF